MLGSIVESFQKFCPLVRGYHFVELLPRDAMQSMVMPQYAVCLSVCPSVCSIQVP